MESGEILMQLKMTYKKLVGYLKIKYGTVPFDYFVIFDEELIRVNNKNSRATSDGLFVHHIDEDKAILLSSKEHAQRRPLEYQRADRLIYCNILEHLILHFKISLEPRHPDAIDTVVGVGGAITYICPQINDYFVGYKFKQKHWAKVFSLIENNFNDYLIVLEYYLMEWIEKFDKNQILLLVKQLTKASQRKQCNEAKEHLENIIEQQKLNKADLNELLKEAKQGASVDAFRIVELYMRGIKVDYNKRSIKKWCRLSIVDKNPEILYEVARVYRSLDERSEEYETLIRESAELGFVKAERELGLFFSYFNRFSPTYEKHREECKFWLDKAIQHGDKEAKIIYSERFFNKDVSKEEMNTALNYLIESANEGSESAIMTLARSYFVGEIVPLNYRKSLKYYLMAEKNGNTQAIDDLRSYHLIFLRNLNLENEKLKL